MPKAVAKRAFAAGSIIALLASAPGWCGPRESEFQAIFARLHVPGGVVLVQQEGRTLLAETYGFSDAEKRVPMSLDSIFWVASLTKPVTAVAMLRKQERGEFSLDDPVSSQPTGPMFPSRIAADTSFRQIINHTSEDPVGRLFIYNGSRYNFALGAFGGTDQLRDAVIADVLKPAGMSRSMPGYGAPGYAQLKPDVVTSYARSPGGTLKRDDGAFQWSTMFPATNLLSTAGDLARFSDALDRGALLNQERLAEMTRVPRSASNAPLPYALGWFVSEIGGRRFVWAYGYGGSASALLIREPERSQP